MLLWPLQLTRDLERCLMGQALKWWTGQSTNGGLRLPEGSYIMWETLQREGERTICKENTIVLREVTVIRSKSNISKNYSPRTLPRKNLCTYHLSMYYFSLLPYHPEPIIRFVEASLFNPLSTNLLYWAFWTLVHSSFGSKSQSPPLHIPIECYLPFDP